MKGMSGGGIGIPQFARRSSCLEATRHKEPTEKIIRCAHRIDNRMGDGFLELV